MAATYSFSEIKSLIPSLDASSASILQELISEESNFYTWYELRAISRFITIANKQAMNNKVKAEFLLSFN